MSFDIIGAMRSKTFECNENLRYIIERTGFKAPEIADLIHHHPSTIVYWLTDKYKMKKETFDYLLEELPDYIEENIITYELMIKNLRKFHKELLSMIHNNLQKYLNKHLKDK